MKKLLLPLAILLFATACTKQVTPAPDNTKASPNIYRPTYSTRILDTLIRPPKPKGSPNIYRPTYND